MVDVGVAQLIGSGKVNVKQGAEIKDLTQNRIVFTDDTVLEGDAIIFAYARQLVFLVFLAWLTSALGPDIKLLASASQASSELTSSRVHVRCGVWMTRKRSEDASGRLGFLVQVPFSSLHRNSANPVSPFPAVLVGGRCIRLFKVLIQAAGMF